MENNCQVFTPDYLVEYMLDAVCYTDNLFGKKVLENSCGSGNILLGIVRRYIESGNSQGYSLENIKIGLESDIIAYETDKKVIDKCISNLNIIASSYGIDNVKWTIINDDYLIGFEKEKYDFIISNPPYIDYRKIDLNQREFIRGNFSTCRNHKFDYYIPFIEKSYNELKPKGGMIYLIPEGFLKNNSTKDIRDYIRNDIVKITVFSKTKVFKEGVSSCMVNVKKGSNCTDFVLYDFDKDMEISEKHKIGEKIIYNFYENACFQITNGKKLGDLYNIRTSIATLLNKAFLVEKDKVNFNELKREGLIYKSRSPKLEKRGKERFIIYPYEIKDEKAMLIGEDDLRKRFPNTYQHLLSWKDDLEKRSVPQDYEWHAYGRSQNLDHINNKKIFFSTIFKDKLESYYSDKNEVVYSGVVIMRKQNEYTFDKLIEILDSDRFIDYIYKYSIPVQGGSRRVSIGDIKDYIV